MGEASIRGSDIGIDTNIEVVGASLTTWNKAHHGPRAKPHDVDIPHMVDT